MARKGDRVKFRAERYDVEITSLYTTGKTIKRTRHGFLSGTVISEIFSRDVFSNDKKGIIYLQYVLLDNGPRKIRIAAVPPSTFNP